jgi:predicted nucleotidyltransferase
MEQLSETILGQITEKLKKSLNPRRIYLFGSYAANSADKDSDVDLLVVVADSETPNRQLTFLGRNSLWGVKLPIDLIICKQSELEKWSGVICNPIRTATQNGRLIYESKN